MDFGGCGVRTQLGLLIDGRQASACTNSLYAHAKFINKYFRRRRAGSRAISSVHFDICDPQIYAFHFDSGGRGAPYGK